MKPKPADGQPMWVITSYYNPAHYASRRRNYFEFRRNLKAPLVTVELASGRDEFELSECDAALSYVPEKTQYISWLDCDLIFKEDDWIAKTCQVLEVVPLTQAYSHVIDLPRGVLPPLRDPNNYKPATSSKAYRILSGEDDVREYAAAGPRRDGFGFGWAARRQLLESHGLYDACILGGGDRAIACAAWGRFADAVNCLCLNSNQAKHYMEWARPFFKDVHGKVGYADNVPYHLWHGSLEGRRPKQRHIDFQQFAFDPYTDIAHDDNECWALNDKRADIAIFMVRYFLGRNEDGGIASSGSSCD